jgi:hypothetical protein
VLLSFVDIAKITITLITLNLCPYISLWFFLTFGDGQIIFGVQKIQQLFLQTTNHDLEVRLTPNKVLGVLFIGIANLVMALTWSPVLMLLNGLYFTLTLAEYFLLDSASKWQQEN